MVEDGASDRHGARRAAGVARLAWIVACLGGVAAADTPGVQRDLVFEQTSPLAHPGRVLERMASPRAVAAMRERLHAARAGSDADPWPALDIATERFELFVPGGAPPGPGFGLVVFVPPWEEQGLPADWLPVLERHGLAVVTATRSGNAQDVGIRRVPLALHAVENVRSRLRIDPERVYAAGFSGGSRVALRLAVGWPDVFRGALLNAGSDPLGSTVPLPEPVLFDRLERTSRLVYFSGTRDAPALAADRASRRSATELCISGTDLFTISGGRHEPADAQAFARALRALETPPDGAAGGEACRERRSRRIAREAHAIAALVDAGDQARAARELIGFDARWSGLARDASRELEARMDASTAHAAAAD